MPQRGPDPYMYHDRILPYIKNEQVFVCPSASDFTRATANWGAPGGYCVNNTGYDGRVVDNPDGGIFHQSPPLDMARFPSPADTIILGDCVPGGSCQVLGVDLELLNGIQSMYWTVTGQSRYLARHNGGANFGFMDGHVKWLRLESLVRPPYPMLTVMVD